jgi:hypothetical protein
MPISSEQEELLNAIFSEAEDAPGLNDWERNFLKDNMQRYKEYGAGINLSPKQWAVLKKIHDKVSEA